jgi:hypothetical protein
MAARPPVTATGICVIRGAQQQQEERSICLVSGSGPAGFRADHNDAPFGRTYAPIPFTTTLVQQDLKDGKLIRWHSSPSLPLWWRAARISH